MTRVWFNHWFSTAYYLIELMKKDESDIYVIGSNRQIDSVISKVCDEWYKDADLSGEAYVDYAIDFCREHKIDVFVPRRQMVEISKAKKRFEDMGVKVLVDDYDTIELLNDKAKTYEYLRSCESLYIPEYFMVNNVEQFKEAYKALSEKYEQVCVKFVRDEGAMSYRRLVKQVSSFDKIRVYNGAEMEYQVYEEILAEKGEFDDLMVMPYLPGYEISVDCLSTDAGLIAIPRFKTSGRHEYVRFDEGILKMAEEIMVKTKLQCPCNIQFKLKDEIPYLLEINTRMSGGLQMGCMAAGVNIPNIALNKLLGKSKAWTIDKSEKTVSHIEMPVII